MFLETKNKVESELAIYIRQLDRQHNLSRLSPELFFHIKEFISRPGKRIRPILFTVGYLGYALKPAPGLFRSALSIELLHDFMLIHDDIIDKSDTRRGKPSMHTLLNKYLLGKKGAKFTGEDLAIVIGDVLYAMALDAFLCVKEKPLHKEAALKKLIEAAFFTGCGEFIELLYSAKDIHEIKKEDIYKIYDLKTANYTFASPLAIGATLAGADNLEVKQLFQYGLYLGRAFQIQDDILGIFSEEEKIGKSNLTDLQEAKKTVLIWHAFRHSDNSGKAQIKHILSKKNVGKKDLLRMREIILKSGALDYAKQEINLLLNKAKTLNNSSSMKQGSKRSLDIFSQQMLSL